MRNSNHFENEYQYFSEEGKIIAHSIIEHNKRCENDISFNNRTFWENIIKNPNIDVGIHYLIITSPFAPQDIIEQAIQQTTSPTTLIEALKQDKSFSDKAYDHILKYSKKEIAKILGRNYYTITPLPFNQTAINYYGKKFFEKSNVKNDKMLFFLTYVKDEDFFKKCLTSPLLNENRLNCLINNRNISDKLREDMFFGNNINNITPDYSAIKTTTPYMLNEIYQSNIEGYFLCEKNDRKNKENILGNIMELIVCGLSTEGIEKDIINQYPKNDKTYERMLKVLLENTSRMEVLKHASVLEPSLFSYAFNNLNITDSFIQECGPIYIDKLLSNTKSKKKLQLYTLNTETIIAKTTLKQEHYIALLKIKNTDLTEHIVCSPLTPINTLKTILSSPNYYLNDSIKMLAELNIEMQEQGFSNDDIYNWCHKILHNRIGYNIGNDYCLSLNFVGIDKDTIKVLSDINNKFDNIMQKFFDKYHPKAIQTYFEAKSAYNIIKGIEQDNPSSIGYYTKKRYELINAYKQQEKLFNEISQVPTLGYLYSVIDNYIDECNNLDRVLDNIHKTLETISRNL